jgi:hypothetical protein
VYRHALFVPDSTSYAKSASCLNLPTLPEHAHVLFERSLKDSRPLNILVSRTRSRITEKSAMLGVPSSIAGMAKGVAVNGKRGVFAIKPTLQTSPPSLVQRQHRRIRPLWQHQLRQLATETTHATPVPPPPPSHRNRVYPAVLLVTFAAVVYVIMT